MEPTLSVKHIALLDPKGQLIGMRVGHDHQ
jgi:hypothetical protein